MSDFIWASLILAFVALGLHYYAEYTRKPKFHNIYDFKEAWTLDKETEKALIGLLMIILVIVMVLLNIL